MVVAFLTAMLSLHVQVLMCMYHSNSQSTQLQAGAPLQTAFNDCSHASSDLLDTLLHMLCHLYCAFRF